MQSLRFRLTGLLVLALLAGGGWFALSSETHRVPHAEPSAATTTANGDAGVTALDVYAHDGVVDVLTVVQQPGASPELVHQRSRDGGRTWSEDTTIDRGGHGLDRPHRGMDPQIAAHGDTVVVLWTTPGTSPWGAGPPATAISRDGGRTWAPGTNPSDTGSTDGHVFLEIVADEAGDLYAFWLDSRDGAQGLRAAVSRDGGGSWAPNVSVDAATCECCWNTALPVGPGRVLVLYRDKDPRDMGLAVTADGGRAWARRATVGTFNWDFDGCPHVGGGLAGGEAALHAVVWTAESGHEGLHLLRSTDLARTWAATARVGTTRARHADIAAEGDEVAAVWDDVVEGATAVYGKSSRDGGATWTGAVRLSAAEDVASHPKVVAVQGAFVAFWTARGADGFLRLKHAVVKEAGATTAAR